MENKKLVKNSLVIFMIILSSFAIQDLQAQFSSDKTNTSSLEALNIINVTLGGDFPISGTYPASRTERVDQLITRIFTEYKAELLRTTPDEELLSTIKISIDEYAKRNIVLKRFTGEEIVIDLVKFRITGDFNFNPYLKNDDVIIFPPLDLERNFIDITGAINKEIKFQFVKNEKLSDAIIIAQGINPGYLNVDSAQISRLSFDGLTEEVLNVKISDNPTLQRGDRIRVLSDENNKRDYNVLVLGEVNRPGKIYITKNTTTLAEVINKAGGFTNEASLITSELIRDNKSIAELIFENPIYNKNNIDILSSNLNDRLKQSKMTELLLMQRMSDVVLEDTMFFSLDNKLKELKTQGVVDFTKIYSDSTEDGEFKLRDGDVIYVPIQEKHVYVYGQVNSPGLIPYIQGMDYNYYINKAGGLGEDSQDDIKLITSKTKSWYTVNQNTEVGRGDFIYVPKDPSRSFGYYLGNAAFISTIASAITTISILIINQLNK